MIQPLSRRLAACFFSLLFATALSAGAGAVLAEPLRVAMSPDYEPLAFIREGKRVGIEVDNATEVSRILGRPLKIIELKQSEYIAALNDGRVDVIMSGYSVTPERKAQVAFTRPFMQIGQMAIISVSKAARFARPRGLYQDGVRIGVEPGTTGDAFVRENMPGATILNYPDAAYAFAALRAGAADVYIHDAPTSWRLASSREDQDLLSLYRPLTQENLAWAVRKDNQILLGQLNAALEKLESNGRLQAIRNYWIPVTVQVR
ncbi:MAG: transporter substrate-binding domain-containing protein [Halieaceae bacterium]